MIKVKTTVTTRKVYSKNGESYWIEYNEQTKDTLKNLVYYALNDVTKGIVPFTTRVIEDDIPMTFDVKTEEQRKVLIEILTKMHKDFG